MKDETPPYEFRLIEGPNIEAWMEGVEPILADVALHLACDAEPLFHKIKHLRKGNISLDAANIPDFDIWFSYYRDSEKVINQLVESLAPYLPSTREDQPTISEIITTNAPLPEEINVRSLFRSVTPQENKALEDMDLDWETAPSAVLFFILIWVPCYCLHGELPTQLFPQAQEGNLKAARKLLQLDKSLIAEPGIAKLIQRWSADGETEKVAKLGSYLGETVADVSLKQVKITWARFILETSERRGQKLSAPKVQELFNAIAQDSGRSIQDPDIGEMSPESFAKALKRREGFWKPIHKSDS